MMNYLRSAGSLHLFLGVLASAATVPASAAVVLSDASFENPALPDTNPGNGNSYLYDPTGTPWTYSYSGSTGVSATGCPFYSGSAPDGNQGAFLQSNANNGSGSISQTVSGLVIGGSYVLTFYESSRYGCGTTPITVMLGSINLGSYINLSANFIQ